MQTWKRAESERGQAYFVCWEETAHARIVTWVARREGERLEEEVVVDEGKTGQGAKGGFVSDAD